MPMGVPRESPDQIFISYAREDSAFATQINHDLQAAGFVTWMDQRNIPAGSHWDDTVQAALDHCTRMVVVLSPASVSSENVMDEVSYARNKRRRIVPLLAAPCDVPFRLQRVHWIDFTTDREAALATLCGRLAEPQPSDASPGDSLRPTEIQERPARAAWSSRWPRLPKSAVVVVLALAIAGSALSLYGRFMSRGLTRALAAVSPRAASLGVFWVAPTGAIENRYWDAKGGEAWESRKPTPITRRDVAAADSAVTVVALTADNLHAFWVGPDRSVRTDFWVRDGNWHYDFKVLGTAADGTHVTAVRRDADQVTCFWIGRERAIWTRSWSAAAQQWSEALRLTEPAVAAEGSSISAVARKQASVELMSAPAAPGMLEVFWVGPDGSIREKRWSQERDWQGLDYESVTSSGSATGATITAISRAPDQLDLFWIAADGSVKTQWWSDKAPVGQKPSWLHPIGSIADAAAAHPGAQVTAVEGLVHPIDVFWIDEDGAIVTRWWDGAWSSHQQSDVLPAGTALVGSSVTAVSRTPNNLDLFWVDDERALWTMALQVVAGQPLPKGKPAAITAADAL